MKSKLSIIFIVIGVALIVVGYVFNILDLSDSFQGLYSGPVILIIGIVFYIFKVNFQSQNALYISSRITFVYKILIPLIGGAGLAIYFMWALARGEMLDLFIPLGLFFTALWVVMVFIGVVIVEIKVNNDTIEVVNYGSQSSRNVKDIESINRFLINFYKVTFRGGSKKIFIPHISEVLLNPLSEPNSIKELRKILDTAE